MYKKGDDMDKRPLYIVGCGGQAKEVYCYAKDLGYEIKGFVDRTADSETTFMGKHVYSENEILNTTDEISVVIAVGTASLRKSIAQNFMRNENISFPTIIAKNAVIYDNVQIGQGCIIGPNAVITTDIKLGDFVLINYMTSVGHDTSIGSYCTINPGSSISGNINIGQCCELGTGTRVIQGKLIADNTVTGAGSVLINDIHQEHCLVVGVPAKIVRHNYGK